MPRPRPMEPLEPRTLLDAVAWTGLGDGSSWHDPANWDANRAPAETDDVTIDLADADPTIRFGLDGLNRTIRSLECAESLQIEGAELAVSQIAHLARPLLLMNGGIGGGAWQADAGMTSPNGRWSPHLAGPIEIAGDIEVVEYAQLSITGGLTLQGTMTIDSAAYVYFDGPQTVARGDFVFLPTDGSNRHIRFRDNSGGTLEFAEQVTISGGAQDTAFISMQGDLPLTIINRGTIRGEGDYARLNIIGGTIENRGLIQTTGTSLIGILAGAFHNEAQVIVSGGVLTVGYTARWYNPGHIALDGGVLALDGQLTPQEIAPGHLTRTGGQLQLTGELLNTGTTLTLDDRTGSLTMNGGVISGGVVETLGSAALISGSTDPSPPDKLLGPITVRGSVEVPRYLQIDGDLTLDGEILMLGGALQFATSAGVYSGAGGGVIRAANPPYVNYFSLTGLNPVEVVFGPGLQIIAESQLRITLSRNVASTVRLQGSLRLDAAFQANEYQKPFVVINEGTIEIGPACTARFSVGEFRNEGHIAIAGSADFQNVWSSPGTIDLQGGEWILNGATTTEGSGLRRMTRQGGVVRLVGRLDNTGETLVLGDATGPIEIEGAEIIGGVIEFPGGGGLDIDATSGSTYLTGLEVRGDVTVAGSYGLRVKGGLAVRGTVSMFGSIIFDQPQTVSISLLELHTSVTTLNFYSTTGGELVFDELTTIRATQTAGNVEFRSYGSTGQVVRSRGRIESVTDGDQVWINCELFVNEGTVYAGARGLVRVEHSADIDAGSVLTGGTWEVAGLAKLHFRNQEILEIGGGATVVKSSPQGLIDGLSPGLRRVDGVLRLTDGAWVECRPDGGVLTLGGTLSVSGAGSFFEVNGGLVIGPAAVVELGLAGGAAPVRVTGGVTLGGRLEAWFAGGFALGDGQSAALVEAGAVSGAFGGTLLPDAPPGDKHALRYGTGLVEMLRTDLADANLDGLVDTRDVIRFLGWWGGGDGAADANGDGVLDSRDVLLFLSWWADG